jgi:hypothetical protein
MNTERRDVEPVGAPLIRAMLGQLLYGAPTA